ncbi:MAG: hypothetical protein LBK08_05170 [Treponema sp.]|jgi:hypothetical protein|nr:hypothetical protein [Treponema sp.]
MKNFIYAALFSIVLFNSCLTIPSNNANRLNVNKASTSWIFDTNSLEKTTLSKNEIVYRDNPVGLPVEAETDLFGKISWFNSLLETFDLHETLSFEEKETFFNALFGFIPTEPTDDFFRSIGVGEYFNDKSPLILYARVYRPSDKAPADSKGILQFTGNFMAIRNNQTGKVDFRPLNSMIIPDMNWSSNGIVFANGSLVKAIYLLSQENENKIKEEAGDNIYLQYVNLADIYIKDEIKSNDDKALEMLDEAFNNATDSTIRIVAKLNTFLYFLYKKDVDSAEDALTIAVQLSEEMENIDPSFKRVVDIEAPTMLKIYKNNN